MKTRYISIATLLPMIVGIFGCAQDVGDINRVQANFVRKADFVGDPANNEAVPEWYIRQTIAHVGPMAAFSFKGMQLDMEKVRWEITETHLIAYRSHELYPGLNPLADHERTQIGDTSYREDADDGHYGDFYKDAPVAAYRIQSHFDIQRQYNSSTGEQTNVIVENSSDRLWHERNYMRVDWSQNVITHLTADARRDSVRWPNACPNIVELAQYIPADMRGDWAFRMERQSDDGEWVEHIYDPTSSDFIDEHRPDYIDFTNRLFVQPPMISWPLGDGRHACVAACYLLSGTNDCSGQEVKVRTSILRVPESRTFHPRLYDDHDMMKFGFFRTERSIYDRFERQTDEGMLRFANIHDIWETSYDSNGDVLPYERRRPKPIYYTLSADFPEDLIPAAEQVAADWSQALARAVAGAQQKSEAEVMAAWPTADGQGRYLNQGLWRINYNEDRTARVGDLRHNFMYWVDEPQLSSPLGYGPSSPDPETGEIISGQAFIYGAAIDTYARFGMKVVQALLGEYDIDEITDGTMVRDFLENRTSGVDPRPKHGFNCPHDHLGQARDLPIDQLKLENLDPDKYERVSLLKNPQFRDRAVASGESRLARLKGTDFEALMVNEEVRGALGSPDFARSPLNNEVIAAARPFTTEIFSKLEQEKIRRDWASRHSIWLADFEDTNVLPIALHIKDKMENEGWLWDEGLNYLRVQITASVLSHEVGHTMGLRHNFQGAFDSINYFDEYWQYRKENLVRNVATVGQIEQLTTPTQRQIEEGMVNYQYSSIMDYLGNWMTNITNLGRYDEAAVIYAYGEAVEVFNDVGSQFRNRYFEKFDNGKSRFEQRGSPAYAQLLETTHYSRIPYMMGNGDLDLGLERLQDRRLMPYSVVKDMRDPSHPGHANRWVEVPYMFCTDHEVGTQGSCHRFITGADLWEQTKYLVDGWENYYWFSNFRRGRWAWNASSVLSRSYFNYFSFLPNFYQHWLWGVYASEDIDEEVQQLITYLGAMDGFNFLGRVLMTPSYGSYLLDDTTGNYELEEYGDVAGSDLFIPRGIGRRPFSTYDLDSGHQFHWNQMEAGHYWDFLAALFAITDGSATVLGADVNADFQSYWIPYYLVFQDELEALFNGLYIEDYEAFGPRVIDGELVHKPLYDALGLIDDSHFVGHPIVEPYHTSSFRFYSLIYGMFGFTSVLDLNFAEQARIMRLGSGEQFELGQGFVMERFENPLNGVVYGAVHEIGSPPNGGVQMIRKGNELKQQFLDGEISRWELGNLVDYMELQRGLAEMFGRAL